MESDTTASRPLSLRCPSMSSLAGSRSQKDRQPAAHGIGQRHRPPGFGIDIHVDETSVGAGNRLFVAKQPNLVADGTRSELRHPQPRRYDVGKCHLTVI